MSHNELIDQIQNCGNCKNAILNDHGYSCYTVMGTDFYCGKSLHPHDGFDFWYGKNEKLNYAVNCSGYTSGDPINMDIYQDNYADLSDEQKQIFDNWKQNS